MTGKEAVLEETGQTFAEDAAERLQADFDSAENDPANTLPETIAE